MSRAMIPGDKEKYSAFQGVGGAARPDEALGARAPGPGERRGRRAP